MDYARAVIDDASWVGRLLGEFARLIFELNLALNLIVVCWFVVAASTEFTLGVSRNRSYVV